MGKKRKKSGGRKKKRRQRKKSAADAPSTTPEESGAEGVEEDTGPGAETPEERVGTDAAEGDPDPEAEDEAADPEEEAPRADAGPASEDRGGDEKASGEVAEVIELEDDLDDPDARADLVAAVAGLAEVPGEAGEGDALDDQDALATEDVHVADEETAATDGDSLVSEGDEPDAEGDSLVSDGDEPDAEGDSLVSDGDEPDADEPDAPLIRPDALVALSEFRDEGVATIPDELVLDLGEAASAEERDRLLAAALAHVEMQDAIYRVPLESGTARRWKAVIAAAIFVMAIVLVALPPAFLVPGAPSPLTTGERLRGIRTALLLQAEQVDAFRVREERLPTSLAEVGTALPGIRFVRSSNRLYQLVAYTPDGEAVVYDSASPDEAFSEIAAWWIDREDGS